MTDARIGFDPQGLAAQRRPEDALGLSQPFATRPPYPPYGYVANGDVNLVNAHSLGPRPVSIEENWGQPCGFRERVLTNDRPVTTCDRPVTT